MVILLLLMFGPLLNCGGGSGPTTTTDPGTPAGSYNLTVVGTTGSDSHTVTVPVTVNQEYGKRIRSLAKNRDRAMKVL